MKSMAGWGGITVAWRELAVRRVIGTFGHDRKLGAMGGGWPGDRLGKGG